MYKRLEDYTTSDLASQAFGLIHTMRVVIPNRWDDRSPHFMRELVGEGTLPSLYPEEAEGQPAVYVGHVVDHYHALLRRWGAGFGSIFPPEKYPPAAKELMLFLKKKPEKLNEQDTAQLKILMQNAEDALQAMPTVPLVLHKGSQKIEIDVPNIPLLEQNQHTPRPNPSLALMLCALPRIAKKLIESREQLFVIPATSTQDNIMMRMETAYQHVDKELRKQRGIGLQGCNGVDFPRESLRDVIKHHERTIALVSLSDDMVNGNYLFYGQGWNSMRNDDTNSGKGNYFQHLLDMVRDKPYELHLQNSLEAGVAIASAAKQLEYMTERDYPPAKHFLKALHSSLRSQFGLTPQEITRQLDRLTHKIDIEATHDWDAQNKEEAVMLIRSDPKFVDALRATHYIAQQIEHFDAGHAMTTGMEKLAELVPEIAKPSPHATRVTTR